MSFSGQIHLGSGADGLRPAPKVLQSLGVPPCENNRRIDWMLLFKRGMAFHWQ